MASGRRDYTWGFLNEAAVEGRYTESFMKQGEDTVMAGATAVPYTYTVPVGYRLTVNRIDISTESRVRNIALILLGVDVVSMHYFSDNYSLVFSDQNPYYIAAGEGLSVQCINQDEITSVFLCTVTGSLMELIS